MQLNDVGTCGHTRPNDVVHWLVPDDHDARRGARLREHHPCSRWCQQPRAAGENRADVARTGS